MSLLRPCFARIGGASRGFLLAVLLFIPGPEKGNAQEDPFFSFGIIDTIVVSGNEKTEVYVILDEMTLKPGAEATVAVMDFDRSRIYSLGLFNNVELSCEREGGKLALHVRVHERWYIIPLPVFGFAEGDLKKPFYGGGILHNNFQGKNQKILALATFGYDPSVLLSFTAPQISREHNLFFSTNLSYARVRNKSEIESSMSGDFDERHYNVNAGLGKRLSLYETLGFNVGFQVVEVEEYRTGRTVAGDGRDAFVVGGLHYTYDSRDLIEYASRGSFLYLAATKYGFAESEVNFTRVNADLRQYIPLSEDFMIAARTHGTIVSGGEVPTYARAYFGFGERIRGYFDDVLEGENLAGGSAEIRYVLLKPRTIHFTAISLPPEFSVWRFGIGLSVFVDTGAAWFRGEPLTFGDFSTGYGGGVNFLLPYSFVVRTEYAWNEFQEGQFILDLKASF